MLSVNENFYAVSQYDYEEFPNRNNLLYFFRTPLSNIFESKRLGKKSMLLLYLYASNFLLNDLFHYILMITVDLFIIIKLKKDIYQRKKIADSVSVKKEIFLSKVESTEIKVTSLILLNASIIFLLRSVHLSLSFFVLIKKFSPNGKKNVSNLCFYFSKLCSNYQETGEIFYLMSITYNFFIYYFLNKNFRDIVLNIFCRKKIVFKNTENFVSSISPNT